MRFFCSSWNQEEILTQVQWGGTWESPCQEKQTKKPILNSPHFLGPESRYRGQGLGRVGSYCLMGATFQFGNCRRNPGEWTSLLTAPSSDHNAPGHSTGNWKEGTRKGRTEAVFWGPHPKSRSSMIEIKQLRRRKKKTGPDKAGKGINSFTNKNCEKIKKRRIGKKT